MKKKQKQKQPYSLFTVTAKTFSTNKVCGWNLFKSFSSEPDYDDTAAKSFPNIMLCIPMDLVGTA